MKRLLPALLVSLLILGGLLLVANRDTPGSQPATFSQLVATATQPALQKAEFDLATGSTTFTTTDGITITGPAPREWMEETAATLATNPDVTVDVNVVEPEPWWMQLLGMVLPLILIGGFLLWFLKRQTGAFGKAGRSLTTAAQRPTTLLADVQGMPETVETMREIIELWNADLAHTGVSPLKGALLAGPPGTGKTLLARAMAGETGCRILAMNGSEFAEVFSGVGAKRVRTLFESARKIAGQDGRAIVFIDEIDSIASSRAGVDHASDSGQDHAQTLNALLSELDGFTPDNRIFLIGATNRPEVIDPALLRPGRFDRVIHVGLPDIAGRSNILQLYVDKQNATDLPIDPDFDVDVFARRCPGASGADLSEIVATATRMAFLSGSPMVSAKHLSEALAEVSVGRARKSAMLDGDDLSITAWHEAGHTAAALLLPQVPDPVEVTVIPRGPAGGITWLMERDTPYHTEAELHADLVVAMAGREGELLRPGGMVSTGAAGDLQKATAIARDLVCTYGMRPGGRVGNLAPTSKQATVEVEALLTAAAESAHVLLRDNQSLVSAIAEELTESETLISDRLRELADAHTAAGAAQAA